MIYSNFLKNRLKIKRKHYFWDQCIRSMYFTKFYISIRKKTTRYQFSIYIIKSLLLNFKIKLFKKKIE